MTSLHQSPRHDRSQSSFGKLWQALFFIVFGLWPSMAAFAAVALSRPEDAGAAELIVFSIPVTAGTGLLSFLALSILTNTSRPLGRRLLIAALAYPIPIVAFALWLYSRAPF